MLFSTVAARILNLTNSTQMFPFLHIFVKIIVILKDVRRYLIVVLICISLMISGIEHFSCTCWPPGCILWNLIFGAYCACRSLANLKEGLRLGWIFQKGDDAE